MTSLSKKVQEKGLSGLECCYGIPGNVGGGVFMNAGAYGGEISQKVVSVDYLDENGDLHTLSKDECEFS